MSNELEAIWKRENGTWIKFPIDAGGSGGMTREMRYYYDNISEFLADVNGLSRDDQILIDRMRIMGGGTEPELVIFNVSMVVTDAIHTPTSTTIQLSASGSVLDSGSPSALERPALKAEYQTDAYFRLYYYNGTNINSHDLFNATSGTITIIKYRDT